MAEPTVATPAVVVLNIPIQQIRPSPHQLRKSFSESGIAALAESMRLEGLIQPITVRRVGEWGIGMGDGGWSHDNTVNDPLSPLSSPPRLCTNW